MIFVLYELTDGELTLLAESGERDRWYYAGDGVLYNESSDSAAKSCFSLCTADRELAYLSAIEYNAEEYADDPWLRFDGETWRHITEEEADSALPEMRKAVQNLDITVFGERAGV